MILEVLSTIAVGFSIPALYFASCKRNVLKALRARNATPLTIRLMPPTAMMGAHAELTCYRVSFIDSCGAWRTALCWVTPFSEPFWEQER